MRFTVFGSGRWASFLAWYTATTGHDTLLCGREGSQSFESLRETRRNSFVDLPEAVGFTHDTEAALRFADIYLIAIGAQQVRSFLIGLKPLIPAGKTIVLCMKGLEDPSGLRLSQVVRQVLGDTVKTAAWVGPGHPQDFVKGIPNCMLIDSEDETLTDELCNVLSHRLIRFYYGRDLIGAEVGAAAKNVIGLAAGMLDGLDLGSLKGVLMARGAREISRLVDSLGGNELTVYGISHLGDYEATLYSPHSHNRGYGEALVQGREYPLLAEGVATARSLLQLSQKTGVELPICQAVVRALDREIPPQEVLTELFLRSTKSEFYI